MKAKLVDMSFSISGKQRVTIEIDTDFTETFDTLKDSDVEVIIKKWREKRTLDENAYFHVLVSKIALARGLSNDEVKKQLIIDYGIVATHEGSKVGMMLPAEVDIDLYYPYTRCYKTQKMNGKLYKCYLAYKRSSEMDTKEMAHLISGAIDEAKALGIDTDTPDTKAWWERINNEA